MKICRTITGLHLKDPKRLLVANLWDWEAPFTVNTLLAIIVTKISDFFDISEVYLKKMEILIVCPIRISQVHRKLLSLHDVLKKHLCHRKQAIK